jgi:hypothetical protein
MQGLRTWQEKHNTWELSGKNATAGGTDEELGSMIACKPSTLVDADNTSSTHITLT